MKRNSSFRFVFYFLGVVLLMGIHSCNEPILDDEMNMAELKSAKNSKLSYVVVLSDAGLQSELAAVKGYDKKSQVVKSAAAKILKRAGIADGELGNTYSTAIQGFSVKIPPGQLKKLQDDPSVELVEQDITISLSPEIKKKPADLPNVKPDPTPTGQETPWGIIRVGGPVASTGVAWIIDTGIDLDHPDLNVDASRGALFARAKSFDDDNGHGTHCAGIIAAIDNDLGVVGVAAGATVVPVKVLDRKGSGNISDVIAGVDYVAANASPGDVANMSLGGPVYTPLDDAVANAAAKGIKFALAAGNESDDANNHSPARVNGTNIYTISAMDSNDNWAYFSNYGNPPVDYCAPGYSIYSTYKNGGYETLSGTSMAAPHVAGLLLLGNVSTDGTVSGDPDGDADPIAHN